MRIFNKLNQLKLISFNVIMIGAILLLFSIFINPATAMTIGGLTTGGDATVGVAVTVSDIPVDADIEFILNNGIPIFARVDPNRTARYLPLVEGSLTIKVTQNRNLINSTTLDVGISPTPTSPPSGGGGGNGGATGGGGVNSREPVSNVAYYETRSMSLIAGRPVTYSFINPKIAIYQLVVTGKNNENQISIKIESLNGTSKLVTGPPPENVYKNLNIWSGSNNIDSILVRFKVENSWISSNSIGGTTPTLSLFRWDQNKWVPLETQEINKDGNYTYFEANTTGLPIFAISTGIAAAPTETETVISTPGGTPEITETTEKPTPAPTKAPGFEIVIAIIGISVIYVARKVR